MNKVASISGASARISSNFLRAIMRVRVAAGWFDLNGHRQLLSPGANE